MQVVEYVNAIDAAMAEIDRVTRRGSRFVSAATNWGSLFWSGSDPELTGRVVSVWERHAPHLPVTLPSLLRAHDFAGIGQRPVTSRNRHFHPNPFGWGAAHLMAAFARTRDALTDDELDRWFGSLREADAAGNYFLSSVPVLTVATHS